MASDARQRGNRATEANVKPGMNRRPFLTLLLVIVALAAACGDPSEVPAGTEPTTPLTTPATTPATTAVPAGTAIAHPSGADDVVLKVSYEGGFVAPGTLFVNIPTLLVSGDGRIFTQGVTPAIFPGPLLPSLLVRSITEQGIQALLGIAQRAGLLGAPPDYSGGDTVADAPNTTVTINAAGGDFVHSAYALGIGSPESPARQALLDVVTAVSDIEAAAGAGNLGVDQPFIATTYRLQARVIGPTEITNQQPAPSVLDWPADAGVALADAATCARVGAGAVGSLFVDAKQNSYFKDGGVTYQLAVAGVLPGDAVC